MPVCPRHTSSFPKHEMPGFSFKHGRSEIQRAREMPGANRTRSLMCSGEEQLKSLRPRRNSRHFPRRWCYGFLRAPRRSGFLVSVASAMRKHRRQLDVSVETSGPHDFAVREICRSSFGRPRVHRIFRPTFVTIAKHPCERGTGGNLPVICPTPQRKAPAAHWHDGQIR
jgi:hypothetical protein